MFAMHDRTRRLLCQLAFVLLCVAPTLLVVTWIGVIRSPVYIAACHAQWETRLSQLLGLSVSLDSVVTSPRGATMLGGVTLTDPETNAAIAHVRLVEMGYNGEELIVLASQPELNGPEIWRLWEVLHERVLRSPIASDLKVHFYAGEVTVKQANDQSASTLTDVRCRLAPASTGPRVTIEFCDVALQMAEPAQLRITRNRQVSPPATRWELRTRSTPLPCSLLADRVQILACMGEHATFQGTVEAMSVAGGWEGEVSGRFRDVDLDRLVTDRYNHKLSGTAELVFRRAQFRGGRLLDAAGDVICGGGGAVSLSLLHQAEQSLGLVADARLRQVETDALRRYQELKFGFTMNEQGLKIVGLCHSVGEGVVMSDYYGPLLTDRPQEVIQVAALVRALASRGGEQVPATFEAHQLLHVLPIASQADKTDVGMRQPTYSPVRLQ
jgi:hypothetical protein